MNELGNPLFLTLAGAGVLAAIAAVAFARLRVVFSVRLHHGAAMARVGTPGRDFLDGCTAVARRHGIRSGRITAVRDGTGIQLRFSRGIPSRSHQAFRNLLTPSPGGGPSGGGRRAAG